MVDVQEVLSRLKDVTPRKDRKQGQAWDALCPAHDDTEPSLTVSVGRGNVILLKCRAGCPAKDIMESMGFKYSDLFPEGTAPAEPPKKRRKHHDIDYDNPTKIYDYLDASGNIRYQVLRYEWEEFGKIHKTFRQRQPDGDGWRWSIDDGMRILYHLPEILEADPAVPILLVEGEKDCDNLRAIGYLSTTAAQGAGKLDRTDLSPLAGRMVAVLPDNDKPGLEHAEQAGRLLAGVAKEVRIVILPGDGVKDASNFIEQNGITSYDKIRSMIEAAQPYRYTPPDEYILMPGTYITSGGQRIERGTGEFSRQVLSKLPKDLLYVRGGTAGELVGAPGSITFRPLDNDRTRMLIDDYVRLGKWKQNFGNPVMQYCPASQDAGRLVSSAAAVEPSIRRLECILRYPAYAPNFKRYKPGWNDDGVYIDCPEELETAPVIKDPDKIRAVFDDVCVDFPFSSDADKENFIGLLITPALRPAIGLTPLHLIHASKVRTGKSKLASIVGYTYIGRGLETTSLPENNEEVNKIILSKLRADELLWCLDNINHHVDSSALAMFLTSSRFSGRVLGVSRVEAYPNYAVCIGTGNNPTLSSEISKRCLSIGLTTPCSQPEYRDTFAHPDLPGYLVKNRRKIFGAILGAIEHWNSTGRIAPQFAPLGGYERWSEVVGGIMTSIGYTQWRCNEGEWQAMSNPEDSELNTFVEAWASDDELAFSADAIQLVSLAESIGVFGHIISRNPRGQAIAMGKFLTKHHMEPILDWRIISTRMARMSRFSLQRITED